jgi:hypothetical protein
MQSPPSPRDRAKGQKLGGPRKPNASACEDSEKKREDRISRSRSRSWVCRCPRDVEVRHLALGNAETLHARFCLDELLEKLGWFNSGHSDSILFQQGECRRTIRSPLAAATRVLMPAFKATLLRAALIMPSPAHRMRRERSRAASFRPRRSISCRRPVGAAASH